MVKTTVYLDTDTALNLRQMAAAEGRSQAEIIRETLSNLAASRARPPIPGAGEFASTGAAGPANVRDILREAFAEGKWRRQRSRGTGR